MVMFSLFGIYIGHVGKKIYLFAPFYAIYVMAAYLLSSTLKYLETP